jgi:hypothetical protein
MLQVLLTPTCHVSGYPRQVIIVEAAETTTVYLDSATNSYNTYNNYTTRHFNTTSWYIFFRDDATSLVHLSTLSTLVTSRCLSLRSRLTLLESDPNWLFVSTELLNWAELLPLITGLLLFWCPLMYCTVGSYREPLVQRLHVICALWVQRVNCYVEKGVRLVAVYRCYATTSLLRSFSLHREWIYLLPMKPLREA